MIIRIILLISLFLLSNLFGQCEDNELQIWDQCYNVDATYELNLSNQQLTGTIPEELSQLSSLMFLDLSNNALEGSIPLSSELWRI